MSGVNPNAGFTVSRGIGGCGYAERAGGIGCQAVHCIGRGRRVLALRYRKITRKITVGHATPGKGIGFLAMDVDFHCISALDLAVGRFHEQADRAVAEIDAVVGIRKIIAY